MFFLLSVIFVSLYGSGYIAMTIGIEYASPSTLLFWRFTIASVIFGLLALRSTQFFFNWRTLLHMSVAGMLNLAMFTMGAAYALHYGLSAAIVAIIIALQPMIVAYMANKFLGESVNVLQKIGYFFGIFGVVLIVCTNVIFDYHGIVGVLFALVGLAGVTFGSFYQKKYLSRTPIISNCFIQSLVAAIACIIISLLQHDPLIEVHRNFILSTVWMGCIVSIVAVGMFYYLIKQYDISRVASLFYLIPISTTLLTMIFFNKQLNQETCFGIAIATLGVLLINCSRPLVKLFRLSPATL